MKKMYYRLLLVIVLLFSISVVGVVANYERDRTESHVYPMAELMELTSVIASERLDSRGVDFRLYENLHLHPNYEPTMIDARHALFRELAPLFSEAQSVLLARGYYTEPPNSVIIHLTAPSELINTFEVGFSHERYFELIDFILDFVGLDEDMVAPLLELPDTKTLVKMERKGGRVWEPQRE